jgi:hypothetical protein
MSRRERQEAHVGAAPAGMLQRRALVTLWLDTETPSFMMAPN